jgi:hypothetical protein
MCDKCKQRILMRSPPSLTQLEDEDRHAKMEMDRREIFEAEMDRYFDIAEGYP